jgi:deoxyguanosine kinase
VWRRLKRSSRDSPETPLPDEGYVRELNEAFNHFFFHYTATPLLVVETSHVDLTWMDDSLDELLRQIHGMSGGTRYYVPRTRE